MRGEGEGEGWACMARVRAARVATSSVPTSAPISPLYLAYISPISPLYLLTSSAPTSAPSMRRSTWLGLGLGLGFGFGLGLGLGLGGTPPRGLGLGLGSGFRSTSARRAAPRAWLGSGVRG